MKKTVKSAAIAAEREFGSFELFFDVIRFYLKNFSAFFPLLGGIGIFVVLASFFAPDKGSTPGILFIIFAAIGALALLFFSAYFTVLAKALASSRNTQSVDYGAAMDETMSRLFPYIWAGIRTLLLIALSGLLLVVPGVYAYHALYLAPVIALAGGASKKKPLSSAWSLSRGNMLTIFFALLAFLVSAVASAAVLFLARFVTAFLLVKLIGLITGLDASAYMVILDLLIFLFMLPVVFIYNYFFLEKLAAFAGRSKEFAG